MSWPAKATTAERTPWFLRNSFGLRELALALRTKREDFFVVLRAALHVRAKAPRSQRHRKPGVGLVAQKLAIGPGGIGIAALVG